MAEMLSLTLSVMMLNIRTINTVDLTLCTMEVGSGGRVDRRVASDCGG